MKKNSLALQIGLAIGVFIFLIEGVLLYYSLESRRSELMDMRKVLQADVMEKAGKNWDELHPGILDEADIERRMDRFKINVFGMTVLISLIVILGTLSVFYFVAGRYIFKINKLNHNLMNDPDNPLGLYEESDIPNNEMGELILSRNEMLKDIGEYQNNLEAKLDEAKDKLVQAAKMSFVGEFTSSIVHDLKNPIGVVSMNNDLLLSRWDKFEDERKLKLLQNSQIGITRALEMIDRMGKFNRSSNKDHGPVDIVKVIDNSLLFLRAKFQSHDIKVLNKIFLDNLTIQGSAPGLEQVFSNLFSNAADAMSTTDKKDLTLLAYLNDGCAVIDVVDTGIGIKEEDLEKIFESFFTTKEFGKGTGLGLSSVKRILEDHNAKIDIKSELGTGTTFCLTFPISNFSSY